MWKRGGSPPDLGGLPIGRLVVVLVRARVIRYARVGIPVEIDQRMHAGALRRRMFALTRRLLRIPVVGHACQVIGARCSGCTRHARNTGTPAAAHRHTSLSTAGVSSSRITVASKTSAAIIP